MKTIASILRKAGKPPTIMRTPDGTRLLILPYGGRLLGLYSKQSEENFYWTNEALKNAESARTFFDGDQWKNSGGDRTWLAPEADLFFPHFPKRDVYFQQRSLDPGSYHISASKNGVTLVNDLAVHFSRSNVNADLRITKSFRPAPNPLRHERDFSRSNWEYAGYTQSTSLDVLSRSKTKKVSVGLWHLVQMPHGGELLIPSYSRSEPRHIFSTVGSIPPKDLIVREHMVHYRMRQKGEHKISVRARSLCGRVGYMYRSGGKSVLIVRNFLINPSGEYVDAPWDDTEHLGFAVQACCINSGLGSFSELEYHVPAVGNRTGRSRCEDESQVWAYRGDETLITRIRRALLGDDRS